MKIYHGFLLSIAFHFLILSIPISPGEMEVPESHGIQIIDILMARSNEAALSGQMAKPPALAETLAPDRTHTPERSEPVDYDLELTVPESVIVEDRTEVSPVFVEADSLVGHEYSSVDTSMAGRKAFSGESILTSFGVAGGPEFLERTIPVYPKKARDLEREGVVVLELELDELGSLVSVDVVKSGGFGFDEAALEAVRKSSFIPATRNGRSVACRAILPVRFVLR